jgi:hypothetical protein
MPTLPPVLVAASKHDVDGVFLSPLGGSGGRLFSLSHVERFLTPETGVVVDAERLASSSRGVAAMGMLSVDAVDDGVLS